MHFSLALQGGDGAQYRADQKRPGHGGSPGMRTTIAASATMSSSSTAMISTISCW
jgi:hypothetical protein